ncbi:hypothetical protein NPIL_142241 [Nephila pilipes]|uniref:Uncharacterized protein n=1 Tax=Nephila pilipes TaxID=299642 RepID=A0A8X6U872_NEPPI|nr:hypothetical protein NPIL_142241 [Nephila pilipes]
MTPTILSDMGFKEGAAQNYVTKLYHMCHKNEMGTKNLTCIPMVRSAMIFNLYQALNIEAELNPLNEPAFINRQNNKINSEPIIPIVKSVSIFMFCNALGIEIKVVPPQEKQF